MKKLIAASVFGLAIANPAHAAKGDVLESQIQEVIEFEGISRDKIYSGSRQWVAQAFKSAQDVIQMDDKDSGVIIAKGNMQYPCSGSWLCSGYNDARVKFTLKIESRDGRARVTFSDIVHYSPTSYAGGFKTPEFEAPVTNRTKSLDTVSQVRDKFEELLDDYEDSVKDTSTNNDDW